ncbi:MAG: type VI secretion system lipoprotein TssJ [Magnetococcus sp. DMHC-1]
MPFRQLSRLRVLLGSLLLSPLLFGCFATTTPTPRPVPPPPPTIVEITLAATLDVNPDQAGRPSPVVVRVYELKTANALLQADSMHIFSRDESILGSDLRSRLEYTLSPGRTQFLRLEMKPDSQGVGVVALFRDYLNTTWRDFMIISPNRVTPIVANIGANRVALAVSSQ